MFDRSTQRKKITFVVGISFLIYAYLTLVPLGGNLSQLTTDLTTALIAMMLFQFKSIPSSISAILTDLIILSGGVMIWTFFFAQFVLPAQSRKERMKVPGLLFRSIGAEKGTAVFIQEGELIERSEESTRKGKGMILLDTASAAILHKKGEFTRAVGPGLVFTEKNEKISNIVDLRKQVRTLGPSDGDKIFFGEDEEDPLAEDPEEQKARQARRLQTSGLTRDGIEVVPNITTTFRLKTEQGEGGTQFGYRDESVKRALLHEAIIAGKKDGDKPRKIPWHWLPAHLAADLWREYLRKFTLNQLFYIEEFKGNEIATSAEKGFDKTAFNRIHEMIKMRLQQEKVSVLNEYGEPIEGESRPSREYEILESHGIMVESVGITNLRLRDEEKLIDRWKATWLVQAKKQEANTEKMHQLMRQRSETQALIEISNTLINPISQEIKRAENTNTPSPEIVLTLNELLRGTRINIVRDPNLNKQLAGERSAIDDILEWLKNYQDGLKKKT